MMFGAGHLLSGLDVATGTLALMVFSAGAAAIVVAILFRMALRRAGGAGKAGLLWVCAVAFFGAIFAYALFDRSAARDLVAERRGVEARAAELTARALAPGSALGCLDAVANALVENGCEKPLFATPETVAAALAYVDARFSLLAASATLAEHDPGYRPAFERLRQGLESDRYGFVAQVLTTRGCSGPDCPEMKLLRDPARVVANMKGRVFESALGSHALAWAPGIASTVTSAPPSSIPMLATTGASHDSSAAPVGTPSTAKFDYPSANSIPAVSIMSAEPAPPPEPKATVSPPPPPKRPAARHHQPAKQAAGPPPAAPPSQPQPQSAPLPPPTQIAPQAAAPAEPPPTPAPARPDPHATR